MIATLQNISTPAYVADVAAIKRNLAIAKRLKAETDCKLLLATKAFSMFSLFALFKEVMDGTTASGYYEAKLGHTHFGGEVHAYSPAFTEAEMEQLIPICHHIYFNSAQQLEQFAPRFSSAKIGLRINPQFSQVTNASIYDPSSAQSRFGMCIADVGDALMERVDILHVHNLCENMAADSVALINHLMNNAPHLLEKVSEVNLGGGHYVTHPDYDLAALIASIHNLQSRFDVRVTLESGGAWVYEAGYLVSTVLDIIERSSFPRRRESHSDDSEDPRLRGDDEISIAILDTSATCHMPDVLEMPYRPHVIGDIENGANAYLFTGRTCLTGDIIGSYRFQKPLKIGDKIVFSDMLQYSMVKNTTFNGVPLPDIGVLEEDGSYRVVKRFGYEDFEERLS